MAVRQVDGLRIGLVGRGRECGRLDSLLEAARWGTSGVLVVRGDAGIGKSALLAYAGEQAQGMTVLRAAGVDAEADLAFAGLYSLLRPVTDRLNGLVEPQARA